MNSEFYFHAALFSVLYLSEMGKSGSKLSPTENEAFVMEVITESEDTLETWAKESCWDYAE